MNSALRIRISVRGRLSTHLAAAFDGMTLRRRPGATELVGEVVDQAQLHGLLTRIRDLGLELESVNVISTQRSAPMAISPNGQKTMTRVVVDHFGGPEVVKVVQDEVPHPGPGEVRVRVLAAGVSYTDAMLRAGSYLGVPNPPFTPGYELVGVVDELGPGCSRLRVGDRIGSLTVWGADAEQVCVLEENAVKVPEDVDPGEIMSLVFTHMTAYQLLHRTARVKRGETVLVHGAAGRVGTAVLELGAVAGLRMYGTCSAHDRAAVEALGGVAIDYRNDDFLAQVHELTEGEGVDVALDGFGGGLSLRSFRALRRGGRLVVFGHSGTVANGRKSWRGWIKWYAATAAVSLWSLFAPGKRVLVYRVQRLRKGHQVLPVSGRRRALPVGGGPRNPVWYREDFAALLELLREGKIKPAVAEHNVAVRRSPSSRVA
jgi:NADPH:quinone reductase-like Zn-dependent oxidoreductase